MKKGRTVSTPAMRPASDGLARSTLSRAGGTRCADRRRCRGQGSSVHRPSTGWPGLLGTRTATLDAARPAGWHAEQAAGPLLNAAWPLTPRQFAWATSAGAQAAPVRTARIASGVDPRAMRPGRLAFEPVLPAVRPLAVARRARSMRSRGARHCTMRTFMPAQAVDPHYAARPCGHVHRRHRLQSPGRTTVLLREYG